MVHLVQAGDFKVFRTFNGIGCWLHSWVDCASEPIIYMNGINLQFAEQMQEFQYLWWQTRVSKGSLLPENARTSRQSSAFQACVLKTCDVIAEVGTV